MHDRAPRVPVFKSLKGLSLPWGIKADGTSSWNNWLSSQYNETVTGAVFDHIKSMGVRTVSLWIWLDRMLVKDGNWGTAAYRVQWDATYKANWESFLKNVVLAKDMDLVVKVYKVGTGATHDFEESALLPTATTGIITATANNGNLDVDTSPADSWPDGWTVTQGGQVNCTWQASSGQPSGATYEIEVDASAVRKIVQSPIVSFDPTRPLMRFDMDLKGLGANVLYLRYFDAAENQLFERNWNVTTTASWAAYSACGQSTNLPESAVKVALAVNVPVTKTVYVGGTRISYGVPSAKHNSYVEAFRRWVGEYRGNTELGAAVAAWVPIKEQYDNIQRWAAHPFLRDLYRATKNIRGLQPIGIEATPGATPPWTAGNEVWYEGIADFYCIHHYSNAGALPTLSTLRMPFVVGECGANNLAATDPAYSSDLYNPTYNAPAVKAYYADGKTQGAGTIAAYDWNDNDSIAAQSGGTLADFSTGRAGIEVMSFQDTVHPEKVVAKWDGAAKWMGGQKWA